MKNTLEDDRIILLPKHLVKCDICNKIGKDVIEKDEINFCIDCYVNKFGINNTVKFWWGLDSLRLG